MSEEGTATKLCASSSQVAKAEERAPACHLSAGGTTKSRHESEQGKRSDNGAIKESEASTEKQQARKRGIPASIRAATRKSDNNDSRRRSAASAREEQGGRTKISKQSQFQCHKVGQVRARQTSATATIRAATRKSDSKDSRSQRKGGARRENKDQQAIAVLVSQSRAGAGTANKCDSNNQGSHTKERQQSRTRSAASAREEQGARTKISKQSQF